MPPLKMLLAFDLCYAGYYNAVSYNIFAYLCVISPPHCKFTEG